MSTANLPLNQVIARKMGVALPGEAARSERLVASGEESEIVVPAECCLHCRHWTAGPKKQTGKCDQLIVRQQTVPKGVIPVLYFVRTPKQKSFAHTVHDFCCLMFSRRRE
jgi:hypothetical protein